jgi:hypothetical protein
MIQSIFSGISSATSDRSAATFSICASPSGARSAEPTSKRTSEEKTKRSPSIRTPSRPSNSSRRRPKNSERIPLQLLRLGCQPRGFRRLQRGPRAFAVGQGALLGGKLCQRGVELRAQRLDLHLRVLVPLRRVVEQALKR